MFIILGRPDYYAWHKAQTRRRLHNAGRLKNDEIDAIGEPAPQPGFEPKPAK